MSNIYERILLLKQTPVFAGVETEDLRIVASVLEEEFFFTGERVFDIKDPSDRLYLIEQGKIGISLNGSVDSNDFVAFLQSNECFGEIGLFDDEPRSATAHVLEDSVLLALQKSKLMRLISSYPGLAFGLLKTLSIRLRSVNKKIL